MLSFTSSTAILVWLSCRASSGTKAKYTFKLLPPTRSSTGLRKVISLSAGSVSCSVSLSVPSFSYPPLSKALIDCLPAVSCCVVFVFLSLVTVDVRPCLRSSSSSTTTTSLMLMGISKPSASCTNTMFFPWKPATIPPPVSLRNLTLSPFFIVLLFGVRE